MTRDRRATSPRSVRQGGRYNDQPAPGPRTRERRGQRRRQRGGLGPTMIRLGTLALLTPILLLAAGRGAEVPAAERGDGDPVRRDTAPPLVSLYLPIPLGVPRVEDPATGVFVPAGYRAGTAVDLVVFLRGYDVKRPRAATAVAA